MPLRTLFAQWSTFFVLLLSGSTTSAWGSVWSEVREEPASAFGVAVAGVVLDSSGLPIPGAVVEWRESAAPQIVRATTTDSQGRFSLERDIRAPGTLRVSLSGFAPTDLTLTEFPKAELSLVLHAATVEEHVTVRAGREPDVMPQTRYRALDVVRTPGAQADYLRFAQTLAGVAQIDEGAGLFVRGGDVGETRVALDGVTLAHPYRYENPTGGWSGSVDAFQLEGITFEAGAFPARHGDALSAVLDLRSLGSPQRKSWVATAGLAGASSSVALPLGKNWGVRLAGNRTWTRLLFAVNGSPRRYETEPEGFDFGAFLYFNGGRFGRIKIHSFAQGDRVGVEALKDGFTGSLRSEGRQRFAALFWDIQLPPRTRITVAAGLDGYRRDLDLGVLSLSTKDRSRTIRVDGLRADAGWALRAGVDWAPRSTQTDGRVPARGGDFGGVSGDTVFRVDAATGRVGAYLEGERRVGTFIGQVGFRIDRFSHERTTEAAPRVAAVWNISAQHRLRVAWGSYAQGVAPAYYEEFRGSSSLLAMKAQHWVAGYEFASERDPFHARVEVYRKNYVNLPLQGATSGYTSEGVGASRGIDIFARRQWSRVQLRANYSLLDARRRFTPADQFERFELPDGTWRPDFFVPHTFVVLGNASLTDSLTAGLAWRRASGRPFTPVVGATRTVRGYEPTYGAINSERLPRYERIDVTASLNRSWNGRLAVFFAGVTNLLGRGNFFEYAYSADFKERTPVITSSPRSLYVGVSISR